MRILIKTLFFSADGGVLNGTRRVCHNSKRPEQRSCSKLEDPWSEPSAEIGLAQAMLRRCPLKPEERVPQCGRGVGANSVGKRGKISHTCAMTHLPYDYCNQ